MKPLTLDQYMDEDYFPENIESIAEPIIKRVNNVLLENKLKTPIVLEHTYMEYFDARYRVNETKHSPIEYGFACKYIANLFQKQGWIVNYSFINSNFKITISHPKSILT